MSTDLTSPPKDGGYKVCSSHTVVDEKPFSLADIRSHLGIKPGLHWWGAYMLPVGLLCHCFQASHWWFLPLPSNGRSRGLLKGATTCPHLSRIHSVLPVFPFLWAAHGGRGGGEFNPLTPLCQCLQILVSSFQVSVIFTFFLCVFAVFTLSILSVLLFPCISRLSLHYLMQR